MTSKTSVEPNGPVNPPNPNSLSEYRRRKSGDLILELVNFALADNRFRSLSKTPKQLMVNGVLNRARKLLKEAVDEKNARLKIENES